MVTGEWRKLHNEEFYVLYDSLNNVRAIKSRRMRWAGYVARMGREKVQARYWRGNLRGGEHLEDPGVEGRIILK
jgi:hypothetical protein